MNKKNGLSRYRQRKLVSLFCADLTATQAAVVGGFNRNTVNRYYRIF
ncbi:MAG TPA: IS1595 family transposase, partial [Rhodobacterales bacterium]|nr:IS1595 family transposase [Rhodobacterales bacterium]